MPTTRKQKSKARRSRGAEMVCDIENIDIMLGTNHFEREESEFSFSVSRRPESPSCDALVNNESNSHFNSRENEIRGFVGHVHNSEGTESSSEFNRLSEELNQRISQEMDGLMSSVGIQIQRAVSEAITEQVLPQIQASPRAGSRQSTQKGDPSGNFFSKKSLAMPKKKLKGGTLWSRPALYVMRETF